jgi:lipopolysaccharide transport system permease protein
MKKNKNVPKSIIEPPKKWAPLNLKELLNYKELLYFFIWRDIKIRYKQTAIGFAWAIIQPLMLMFVFTFFFGGLAKVPSEGIPYPLFSFSALLPWTLFSEGLTRSTNSMVSNSNIMTKVYFPRLILPIAGVLSPIVDFVISLIILFIMIFYYGYTSKVKILLVPIFIILCIMTSFAIGIWLSALNVKYRDFQYALPFVIQIMLFLSPVVYSSNILPEKYQILYSLNPMVGVIEGFRWVLVGGSPPELKVFISLSIVVVLILSGLFHFKKMEQYFADII